MSIEEKKQDLLRRIENNELEFSEEDFVIIENDEDVYLPLLVKVAHGECPITEEVYDLLNTVLNIVIERELLPKEDIENIILRFADAYLHKGFYSTNFATGVAQEYEMDDEMTHILQRLADNYLLDPDSMFEHADIDDELIVKLVELKRFDVIESFKGQMVNGYIPTEEIYNLLIETWPYEKKPFIAIMYEKNNGLYHFSTDNTYSELLTEYEQLRGSYKNIVNSSFTENQNEDKKIKILAQIDNIRKLIKEKIFKHDNLDEFHKDPSLLKKLIDDPNYSAPETDLFKDDEAGEIALELFNNNILYYASYLDYLGLVTKEQVEEKVQYCLNNHLSLTTETLEYFHIKYLNNPDLVKLLVDYGQLNKVLNADYYLHYTEALDNRQLEDLIPYIIESIKYSPLNKDYLTKIDYRIIQYPEIAEAIIALGEVTQIDLPDTGFNDKVIELVIEASKKQPFIQINVDVDKDNHALTVALISAGCYKTVIRNVLYQYLSNEEFYDFVQANIEDIAFVDYLIGACFTSLKYENPEILNELIGRPYATEQILIHLEYAANDVSFISEEAMERLLKYMAKKNNVNERNLIKIEKQLGPNIVKYFNNDEFYDFVDLPEEELDKILALLPKGEYTMRDVEAGYESIIQHLFIKMKPNEANIFSEFLHAIEDQDEVRIKYLKERLIIDTSLDFLFKLINEYDLDNINDTDDLLNLIIEKLSGPEREHYIDILHDLTDEYVSKARDRFHNYHYFDIIHPSYSKLFDEMISNIDNNESIQLKSRIEQIASYLDDKFYKSFSFYKSLPEECKDPRYLLEFLCKKIADPTKRNKYLPFLKEAVDYYVSLLRNKFSYYLTMGDELKLPYKNEPRNTRSAINKFYVTRCHLFETEDGELLKDLIYDKLVEQGVPEEIIDDCINYYGTGLVLYHKPEEVKQYLPQVIKTANEIVRSHKIYNTTGLEPEEQTIIDSLNANHELIRLYYVGAPKMDPYQILISLNMPLLRKNLLNNEAMYNKLLEIMKKRKLHLMPSCFDYLFLNGDICADYYTIASFINYFTAIYENERKRMIAIGKHPDDALSSLTSILIQADTYGRASGVYSQILGPEDARLIRANPEPFSSTQFEGNTRMKMAVELTEECYRRQTCTIPTFDKTYELDSEKKMNVIVGNLTAPCNLTHGERTGACMRIGGIADSLLRFCITNPNGFFIRFEDPETHEYISRVSGFRNGNTVFLNQLRCSCIPDKYDDYDVIEACSYAAEELIELTKDSSCPIENVVVTHRYALEDYFDGEVFLGIADNKEGLPRFYSDIGNSGVILATTARETDFAPVKLDKSKVPTYPMCRSKVTFSRDPEELAIKINRVASVKAILAGADYEDLTPVEFPDGLLYGMATDDWYIYVNDNGEISFDYIDIDPRAKEEVTANLMIVEQMIDREAPEGEIKHGL